MIRALFFYGYALSVSEGVEREHSHRRKPMLCP